MDRRPEDLEGKALEAKQNSINGTQNMILLYTARTNNWYFRSTTLASLALLASPV